MKISDDDRELARALADSFGLTLDPWQERMFAIVLWSHRQRPADALGPYTSDPTTRTRVACGSVYDDTILRRAVRCVREAGHHDDHRSLDGVRWFISAT